MSWICECLIFLQAYDAILKAPAVNPTFFLTLGSENLKSKNRKFLKNSFFNFFRGTSVKIFWTILQSFFTYFRLVWCSLIRTNFLMLGSENLKSKFKIIWKNKNSFQFFQGDVWEHFLDHFAMFFHIFQACLM